MCLLTIYISISDLQMIHMVPVKISFMLEHNCLPLISHAGVVFNIIKTIIQVEQLLLNILRPLKMSNTNLIPFLNVSYLSTSDSNSVSVSAPSRACLKSYSPPPPLQLLFSVPRVNNKSYLQLTVPHARISVSLVASQFGWLHAFGYLLHIPALQVALYTHYYYQFAEY